MLLRSPAMSDLYNVLTRFDANLPVALDALLSSGV